MQTYFRNNQSEELIILFSGWGMDEKPYNPIKSSRDILFVYNYTDLDSSLGFDFSKYKKIILISFSAGVFMASYLKDILPNLDLKIAVNGTLHMLDDIFGLPETNFLEMGNINLQNVLEFRKKLVDKKKHLDLFNKYQPSRDLKSSLDERSALKRYYAQPTNFNYDKIIISENDKIIPAENQLRAWEHHTNIKKINSGHFMFYEFTDFDEIINF